MLIDLQRFGCIVVQFEKRIPFQYPGIPALAPQSRTCVGPQNDLGALLGLSLGDVKAQVGALELQCEPGMPFK